MKATLKSTLAVLAVAAAMPAGAWSLYPAPRAGYIWSPPHYEWTGTRQVFVPGVWIVDDYDRQWRSYASNDATILTTGPIVLRDRDGNVIPITPDAYPVDSARK